MDFLDILSDNRFMTVFLRVMGCFYKYMMYTYYINTCGISIAAWSMFNTITTSVYAVFVAPIMSVFLSRVVHGLILSTFRSSFYLQMN